MTWGSVPSCNSITMMPALIFARSALVQRLATLIRSACSSGVMLPFRPAWRSQSRRRGRGRIRGCSARPPSGTGGQRERGDLVGGAAGEGEAPAELFAQTVGHARGLLLALDITAFAEAIS